MQKKLALYIIHEENHQIYSSIIHKIGSKNICNTENLKKKSYKITISYAIPQEMLWKEKMWNNENIIHCDLSKK